MRIGLIADIHGNVFALDAVLAALDRLGMDETVCLGDVASPGPWPIETITRLRDRGIPAVMGNTDEWLLAEDPSRISDFTAMNHINAWAAIRLDDALYAWIEALPRHRTMVRRAVPIILYHGSPRSTTDVISSLTPTETVAAMLSATDARIAVGGHTHVPMLRTTDTTLLVNPGSVGLGGTGPGTHDLPLGKPATGAEFAVLELTGQGVSLSFHSVGLDTGEMIAAASTTEMPHLESWAALWSE